MERSRLFGILPDGSPDFGGGIIGPSLKDQLYFNSLKDSGKPIKHRRNKTLAAFSYAGISSILSACTGGDSPPPIEQPIPKPARPVALINRAGFVRLPFPVHPDMKIQRAWLYTDEAGNEVFHGATDYIKGKLDEPDTWITFPVLAAADGQYCANPPRREGLAVFAQHEFGGRRFFSYSGHLSKIEDGIPLCEGTQRGTRFKKIGEKIGDAGSTGAVNPNLIHLHQEWKDTNGEPFDIYDILQLRDDYPDPLFSNGKYCGPQTLLINCPIKEPAPAVLGARTTVTPLPTLQTLPTPDRRPQPLPANASPTQVAEAFLKAVINEDLSAAGLYFAPDKKPTSWQQVSPFYLTVLGMGSSTTMSLAHCSNIPYLPTERAIGPWRSVSFVFDIPCGLYQETSPRLSSTSRFRQFLVVLEEANNRWYVTSSVRYNNQFFITGKGVGGDEIVSIITPTRTPSPTIAPTATISAAVFTATAEAEERAIQRESAEIKFIATMMAIGTMRAVARNVAEERTAIVAEGQARVVATETAVVLAEPRR